MEERGGGSTKARGVFIVLGGIRDGIDIWSAEKGREEWMHFSPTHPPVIF